MAEIKSSIQIALERAAALGASDKDEERREEGRRQGKAWARRAALGELAPSELRGLVDQQAGAEAEGARAAAGETLLGEIAAGNRAAMAALMALSAGTPAQPPAMELARLLKAEEDVAVAVSRELAAEMLAQLAAEGISGPAVHPNPAAHPQLQARFAQAAAGLDAQRQAATRALAKALAQV
ncbi:MAG: hypothetical protein ACOZHQ_03605 [Thermodesulfobacteriota bacterium]